MEKKDVIRLLTGCAYIRVSTDKQEELSPNAQKRLILEYAKSNNIVISEKDIYIENGISGRKADKRPMFQEMIARAKSKEHPYDCIIVWKFSRFARNQEESIVYKSMLKKDNVEVVSISEPLVDGPFGSLIERIIEWMDEYYSIRLSGEVMRGMTEKALKGGYQATTPLGYIKTDKNDRNCIPTIDANEAHIVQLIFDKYNSGSDFSSIARYLNEAGYRTRRNNLFELRTIRYVLKNPFYIGKVRWNRAKHSSYFENDPDTIIIADGKHEPIISADDFTKANDRINAEFKPCRRKGAAYSKHWLCGILKCGYCGANLIYYNDGRYKSGKGNFQCYKYGKGYHKESCSVSEAKIEKDLYEVLDKVLVTGNIEFEYTTNIENKVNTDYLKRELDNLEKKEKRIKLAYMDGIDSLNEYKNNKKVIESERDNILKKMQPGEREIVNPDDLRNKMLMKCNDVYDILKSDADLEKKTNAIRSVCESITYDKENKAFEYIFRLS